MRFGSSAEALLMIKYEVPLIKFARCNDQPTVRCVQLLEIEMPFFSGKVGNEGSQQGNLVATICDLAIR
jgi:hypothetical protein